MGKVKFGKQLEREYKRAQSKMRYYGNKYDLNNGINKLILHETRHQYTQAIKKYNEGHMSKSELLRYRNELRSTVKNISKEYSKENRSVLENTQGSDTVNILETPSERDIVEYSRRLGMHGVNNENALDQFEYIADVLTMDVDDILDELYREGREGNIKYKEIDVDGEKKLVQENEYLLNLREQVMKKYNLGEIDDNTMEKAINILS